MDAEKIKDVNNCTYTEMKQRLNHTKKKIVKKYP